MKCIALVVGIDHYNDVDNYPELHTAVSDANAVAEVLQELKFEVDAALDEDDIVTLTYYGDFIDKLSKKLSCRLKCLWLNFFCKFLHFDLVGKNYFTIFAGGKGI